MEKTDSQKIAKITRLLEENGIIITNLILDQVIKDSQKANQSIDYTVFFQKLINTGLITEEKLTQVLAQLDGVEYFDYFLFKDNINKDILKHFHKDAFDIFRQYFFVPLKYTINHSEKKIVIEFGMKNPRNLQHVNKIEEVINFFLLDKINKTKYSDYDVEIVKCIISVSALQDYFFHFLREISEADLIESANNINIDIITSDDTERTRTVLDFLQKLIAKAVFEGVSDIHFEPDEKTGRIKFRKNGILLPIISIDINKYANILTALALNCSSSITPTNTKGMDGRIEEKEQGGGLLELLRINYEINNVDYRVSYIPNALNHPVNIANYSVVIRILSRRGGIPSLEQLGFSTAIKKEIASISEKAHGIFLITGPTGSGKSTTLYSILSKINATQQNVMTIEDPVEYRNSMWKQVQLNERADMTFANAIKYFLRHDPDVILLGEIRDPDTAKQAIIAANTGHLVLTTLHTNNAPSAISRLINLGVNLFDIIDGVIAILAQRLVRKVCPKCAFEQTIKNEDREWLLKELERTLPNGIDPLQYVPENNIFIENPNGCEYCNYTGFLSRTVITEICILDKDIKSAIMKNQYEEIYTSMLKFYPYNMLLLSGIEKVLNKITTISEVKRVI